MKQFLSAVSILSVLLMTRPTLACDLRMKASHGKGTFAALSDGAGAHGGEKIQSDFFRSQKQAAHVVDTVRAATLFRATEDPSIRNWVIANKDELKRTIEEAKILFNDSVVQKHCAEYYEWDPNTIHISRPRCQNITSIAMAGELLIHEALHIMGYQSETFEPAVAYALYLAWEYADHSVDNRMHRINANLGPLGRTQHTGVWSGEELLVWGGLTRDGLTNSGGRYDLVLDRWRPMTSESAPSARFGHTSIWAEDEMIVWGGAKTGLLAGHVSYHYRDGSAYNPKSDQWRNISLQGAPSARFKHTAVWSGKEMLIWGGVKQRTAIRPKVNYEFMIDAGKYDPKTNTWSSINQRDSLSPRFGHSAVWSFVNGGSMLVWGGQAIRPDGSVVLSNEGAIYSPTSNSWTPMNQVGAPTPRFDHNAVSTGDRLIVWGGYAYDSNGVSPTNTGAIYDVKSETWEAINQTNAPVARDGQSAVWSGSHLIIFGGRDPVAIEPEEINSATSDGYQVIALYDPVKREWTQPIIDDVWMDRRNHVAAWTGHELIVWGGNGFRKSGRVFYPQNL